MQINLATIEQHVGEKLRRIEGQPESAERLSALKKFLKIETQRLHLRHRFGISGSQIVAARSLIVDLMIQRIARMATLPEAGATDEFAVVALGGYGRQELAPQSDIDLMFLHQGRKTADATAKCSEAILYLLWDVGFSVGHSVRSLGECVAIAKEDLISRNSMIDARLLWGSRSVFDSLVERLEDEVFEKRKREFLDELMVEREARYNKFGNAVCLQEPNIKETAGGLRDLHTLLWASRIAHGVSTLDGLVGRGVVPDRDAKAISAAYDFLLRARNDLHFLTGRKGDLLSLDLQPQVARSLRYEDGAEQQASEIFMREYYLHARRLRRLCETHLQRAAAKEEKRRWFSRARSAPAIGGFVIRDGMLDAAEPASGEELDGNRMMMAFGYAQATGAPLSTNLQDTIQSSLPAINRTFRSSPEAASAFLKMLRAKGRVAAGLRLMHELDFLGKFLPEFGRVTCLVQHDLYHRFTVDEHTLRTVEVLDELANSRSKPLERFRGVYAEVQDPAALHLALLMHDIGKGLGGGHTEKGVAIAERVCQRLRLDEETAAKVVFLVRHHLLMSDIAQRRDLSDEKVILDFAARMGTLEHLNLLCLLTYADISGVGSGVWNEWKDTLVWELYTRARALICPEKEGGQDTDLLKQRIERMLVNEVDVDDVRAHFSLLPPEYIRTTPSQTIIEHVRLAGGLNSRLLKTSWRVNTQTRCTDLHLCARNRRGLFAKVAGTLTSQGVNILSVHLNTRADGIAIDTFRVRDTAGEPINDPMRWEQIDAALKRALAGELDVEVAVAKRLKAQSGSRFQKRKLLGPPKTRITWDNQSSDRSTILEVRTGDRLGLAYRIASTLSSLDLDIVFAKVATEKYLALDIFYVTNERGEKLPDDSLPALEERIRTALKEGAGEN